MNIDYKGLLEEVQKVQLDTIVSVAEFKGNAGTTFLARKRRGLYWLWTSLTNEELQQISYNDKNIRHVPISKLIAQRKELKHICKVTLKDYRIVYNGIGGYRTLSKSFGLRERILQEITCNDARTGTLNISSGCEDLNKWAVSFFDFDDDHNKAILKSLNSDNPYIEYATILENLWRLEYGTPILCRQ